MTSGRELEALRRLQQSAGIKKQIKLIVSKSALEPGIVGVFRPILLLPAGISDRLSDAQMEAIITHELCHVRRRDNLTAAVHMLSGSYLLVSPSGVLDWGAAGITGSNLKKRIEAIMVHRMASKLNLMKKLLLTAAAAATLALPVVFGVLHPAQGHAQSQQATTPVFQDVSLKAPQEPLSRGDLIRTRFTFQNGVLDAKGITLQHLFILPTA